MRCSIRKQNIKQKVTHAVISEICTDNLKLTLSNSGACTWITKWENKTCPSCVSHSCFTCKRQTSEQSSFQTNASTTQKQIKKSGITTEQKLKRQENKCSCYLKYLHTLKTEQGVKILALLKKKQQTCVIFKPLLEAWKNRYERANQAERWKIILFYDINVQKKV